MTYIELIEPAEDEDEDGEYGFERGYCAAAGCEKRSEMVDATKRFSDHDVPFCSACWVKADDAYEEVHYAKPRPSIDNGQPDNGAEQNGGNGSAGSHDGNGGSGEADHTDSEGGTIDSEPEHPKREGQTKKPLGKLDHKVTSDDITSLF